MCQKARIIVQKGHGGSTTPSVTSTTRTNAPGRGGFDTVSQLSASKFSDRTDIRQLQKLLSRNPELSQVVSQQGVSGN